MKIHDKEIAVTASVITASGVGSPAITTTNLDNSLSSHPVTYSDIIDKKFDVIVKRLLDYLGPQYSLTMKAQIQEGILNEIKNIK